MNTYLYSGPVLKFDVCIENRWHGSTHAVSAEKARSNLIYRYKKEHNFTANSRIALPGEIMLYDDTLAKRKGERENG